MLWSCKEISQVSLAFLNCIWQWKKPVNIKILPSSLCKYVSMVLCSHYFFSNHFGLNVESATVYKVDAPALCNSWFSYLKSIRKIELQRFSSMPYITVHPTKEHCRLLLLASNPAAKYVRKIRYLDEEGFGIDASVDMRGWALPAVWPVAVPGIELISWLWALRLSKMQHPFVVPI